MALARGSHLGPYDILSAVSAGGMGEVYLAEDTRLGRRVAIKDMVDHILDGLRKAGLEIVGDL